MNVKSTYIYNDVMDVLLEIVIEKFRA
jgi:hypothetical protein